MHWHHWSKVAIVALGLSLLPGMARADAVAECGRKVVESWQHSMVSLEVVCKIRVSMGGQEETNEEKMEASGTIIDDSGLIVSTLTSVDPASVVAEIMEGIGEEDGPKPDIKAEITSVKIILPDGKDIPGQLVLRDKDLDLAFIRPLKTPDKPLTPVRLTDAATPKILDIIFLLYRLDVDGNKLVAAKADRIESILPKPRLQYIPLNGTQPGNPVFTEDGKLVGVLALRRAPKVAGMSLGASADAMLLVIVPGADIQEVAKEAPAAKPPK